MRETTYWYGSEAASHRELVKACKARCKLYGKGTCPRPDYFCPECEDDRAVALRTFDPSIIEAIQSGQYDDLNHRAPPPTNTTLDEQERSSHD